MITDYFVERGLKVVPEVTDRRFSRGKNPNSHRLRFDLNNVESLCWYCHYIETFGKEPTEKSIKFGDWQNYEYT